MAFVDSQICLDTDATAELYLRNAVYLAVFTLDSHVFYVLNSKPSLDYKEQITDKLNTSPVDLCVTNGLKIHGG